MQQQRGIRTGEKLSGVPIIKGSRVQADSIVENYADGSPVDEISENFAIPQTIIRAVLAFAQHNEKQPRPRW